MSPYRITSALCTPLTESEKLHEAGLEAHLDDQFRAGISSILVGGSMGAMQLLTDGTYRRLLERTVERAKGRFEVFVGAGDTGFARTREKIRFLNQFPVDAIVVLSPYLFQFSQEELIDYFQSLAAVARVPLYLYDLPQLTGTKLEIETVLRLARHPNIAGIKCSDEPGYGRQLHDLVGESFRVIVAQPDLLDVFLRHGLHDHLDGMYAVAPHWTMALAGCATRGDWNGAAVYQQKLSRLRRALLQRGDWAFTAVLNARGIPGIVAPRPARRPNAEESGTLLQDPVVQDYLQDRPAAAAREEPLRTG